LPQPQDAEDFQRAKEEMWPEIQQWSGWGSPGQQGRAATDQLIQYAGDMAKTGNYSLMGRDKATGAFAAAIGLHRKGDPAAGEFVTGYWVTKDFLGQGYATEAANAMIRCAFGLFGAKKIHAAYSVG